MITPVRQKFVFSFLFVSLLLNTSHATTQISSVVMKSLSSLGGSQNDNSPLSLGPIKTFVKTINESRSHLAAAAVARGLSIFAMFPVDTIKTRIQMAQSNPLRVKGLYNGVVGSLIGNVPYGVLTFGSYEIYKKELLKKLPDSKPVLVYALAAVLGDITGSGWLCPSEVVKQQMQAGMFSSTKEAFTGILREKGFGGLYQGYLGGLARDIPFRVAQLTSYEVAKDVYLRFKEKKQNLDLGNKVELSPIEAAACGAIAGSFAAAITSPLDRIKTLLMTDSGSQGGTVASCALKIWKEEGAAGFLQGIIPRVSYIAPSVAIFFIIYEQAQQRFSD